LLNVLKNAQQAACEGKESGIVTVRSFFNKAANAIRIEVSDNGPGIPATIESRVFEPFFSTKGMESGTGLGLAVSKRIVEDHQGKLSFESAPGHGTMFVIELPVSGNQNHHQ
jgi:signal transduction histidine kinase